MLERYERKGFEFIFSDDKTLVKTDLQVFLLCPRDWNYSGYINEIRSEVTTGNIKNWDELCSMLKHRETGELVVNMIAVSGSRYL